MRLFGAILRICILFVLAFTISTEIVAQEKTDAVKVTAKQLLTDYKGIDNELDLKKKYKEGDDTYKGKTLEITGIVSNVLGAATPYFRLEGGTGFKMHVNCAFGKENMTNLKSLLKEKKLKVGARVTVKGTCSGISRGLVQIDDCIMVDPPFPK